MRKILIIDDSSLIRSKIKQMLSTFHQSEVEAQIEPNLALEYVRKHKPDVVILDIELKQINGVWLLDQIKKFDPKIKVIVFTNLAITAFKNTIREINADYYFDKTTEIPEFLSLFRSNEIIANNLSAGISATNAQ